MISLAPEILTQVGPFPITNTLLGTLLVDVIIVSGVYYAYKHISVIPGKFQSAVELVFDEFYALTATTATVHTQTIFEYVITFFIFVLVANFSDLIPGITAFGFYHGKEMTPFIRSAVTDLNTTFALALVSQTAAHMLGIRTLGLKKYLNKFFSLKPIELYSGLLELISEFTKVIAFSFRLFGNMFVDALMLELLSASFALLLPIPLVFYEYFVAIVQAMIFALLTMAFMAIMTTAHNAIDE
jgi:F-type H+-transporting ATPase subunit a